MNLNKISGLIILLAISLLLVTAIFPSPLLIGLTATLFSFLVLWQAYAILRDDSPDDSLPERTPYEGYLRK